MTIPGPLGTIYRIDPPKLVSNTSWVGGPLCYRPPPVTPILPPPGMPPPTTTAPYTPPPLPIRRKGMI